MMTGLLVKQRTDNLKARVPAHGSTIPGIKRFVHENELQLTHVGDASMVEVVTLNANWFVKTQDPIAHSFVTSANAFEVWRAGKILCVNCAFERNHGWAASQTLRMCRARRDEDQS
jgi:hypothetical protein